MTIEGRKVPASYQHQQNAHRMTRCFAHFICGAILLTSTAQAQPVFQTYQSLEARVAQATSIYRGRISKCTGTLIEEPKGNAGAYRETVMRYTLSVDVDEVLKGTPLRTLELVQETSRGDQRSKQWADAHTSFVWFIGCGDGLSNVGYPQFQLIEPSCSKEKPTPWHAIRVDKEVPAESGYTKDGPLYLMDFTHLSDPSEILAHVRQLIKSPDDNKGRLHTFRITPRSWLESLIVPVQPPLESVAKHLIATPDDFVHLKDGRTVSPEARGDLRTEGVNALRYFKSPENIRMLKSLLNDSYVRVVTDDETNVTSREYPVRSEAAEVLKAWGECASLPDSKVSK